jgi:hypothetical protein
LGLCTWGSSALLVVCRCCIKTPRSPLGAAGVILRVLETMFFPSSTTQFSVEGVGVGLAPAVEIAQDITCEPRNLPQSHRASVRHISNANLSWMIGAELSLLYHDQVSPNVLYFFARVVFDNEMNGPLYVSQSRARWSVPLGE